MNRLSAPLLSLTLPALLLAGSCTREAPAPGPTPKAAAPSSAPATVPAGTVAKIVFVGQADACECTRTRIDKTWAALQQAVARRRGLPVERLRLDTDEAKVAPYQKLGAIMVPPGIYLLDGAGGLVKFLQGEVTAEQLAKALR